MKSETKEEPKEQPKTEQPQPQKKNWLKISATIFLLAFVGFVGFDGYINKWAFVHSLLHYNQLQLQHRDGRLLTLKAHTDFQLVRVEEISSLFNPDSLDNLDAPLRQAGFSRLYFRMSDSSSAKMERLYQVLARLDTTESIRHSIEDTRRRLLYALKIDTTAIPDSLKRATRDTTKHVMETGMTSSDKDFTTAVGRLLRNPHLALGAGIGVAAALGIDLLHGDAYVVIAKEGTFPIDSIAIGPQAGHWEGNPIDILWTFGKEDSVRQVRTLDSLSVSPDSLLK